MLLAGGGACRVLLSCAGNSSTLPLLLAVTAAAAAAAVGRAALPLLALVDVGRSQLSATRGACVRAQLTVGESSRLNAARVFWPRVLWVLGAHLLAHLGSTDDTSDEAAERRN